MRQAVSYPGGPVVGALLVHREDLQRAQYPAPVAPGLHANYVHTPVRGGVCQRREGSLTSPHDTRDRGLSNLDDLLRPFVDIPATQHDLVQGP